MQVCIDYSPLKRFTPKDCDYFGIIILSYPYSLNFYIVKIIPYYLRLNQGYNKLKMKVLKVVGELWIWLLIKSCIVVRFLSERYAMTESSTTVSVWASRFCHHHTSPRIVFISCLEKRAWLSDRQLCSCYRFIYTKAFLLHGRA